MKTIVAITYFVLTLINPLEKLNIAYESIVSSSGSFVEKQNYLMPFDGIIREIITNNGKYTIILESLDDGNEYVYSGLNEIYVERNQKLSKGFSVGMDISITLNTEYILMYYDNLNIYPQFNNGKLIFLQNTGTKIYLPGDSTILKASTAPEDGNFLESNINESVYSIRYKHLATFSKDLKKAMKSGDLIGYSGFTGIIKEPQLCVEVYSNANQNDYRVIYCKYKE